MNEAHTYLSRLLDARVESISYLMYSSFAARGVTPVLPSSVRPCLDRFLEGCTLRSRMRACIDAVKPNSRYRREFVELFGPTIEKHVDVVLCQFPGFQCALFMELKVGLALRFTHRFDHHIWYGDKEAKGEWDKMLVQWHTRLPHTAIFADNPYDAEYLWHFLRVPAIPWPAVGLRLIVGATRPALKRNNASQPALKKLSMAIKKLSNTQRRGAALKQPKVQWCWCCFGSRPSHAGTQQLMTYLQTLVPELRIGYIKELRVDPNAASLAQTSSCTAFILIPHSLHSYTSVEVYAVGYPMIVPSAALLAHWHETYEVVQHRCPGNKAWMPSLQGPGDSPLSPHTADIARWLTHVDFLRWPHVHVLHHNRDLRRTMASTPHALQASQSHYMQMASFEALPRVESALRDIVQGAQEERTRDDGTPPWNGTRALVQLAALCQQYGLRVRPSLREGAAAERAWSRAQRGQSADKLCVVERWMRPPPPAAPVSRGPKVTVHGQYVGTGLCEITHVGQGARCAPGDTKGSWEIAEVSDCWMRCAGCSACSFISFNPSDRDCSWFTNCSLPLNTSVGNVPGFIDDNPHRTYRVRAPDGTLQNDSDVLYSPPLPPPPPPKIRKDWCMPFGNAPM